jgi:hypothetical protein
MEFMLLLVIPSFNKANEFVQFLDYKEVWHTHEVQQMGSRTQKACIKQNYTNKHTTDELSSGYFPGV